MVQGDGWCALVTTPMRSAEDPIAAKVRAALRTGDDAAAVAAARTPGFSPDRLLRREQVQVEQAMQRLAAVEALAGLVAAGDADARIAAAWWRARALGCAIPQRLLQAGQQARLRLIESRLSTTSTRQAGRQRDTLREFPQPPARSLAQAAAVEELDQGYALQWLHYAVACADDRAILRAAREVRHLGGLTPDFSWEPVAEAQARQACLVRFQRALASGEVEEIAQAWHAASAVWPGALSAEDDELGRAMFRAWGSILRQRDAEARSS